MSQKSWHFKCEKNNIDLLGFMRELLRGGIFRVIFSPVNMPPHPFYRTVISVILPPQAVWGGGIFTVKMHTVKWGGHIYGKKITVNMPPLKSSLIKPSKSMLFFHIWSGLLTCVVNHIATNAPKKKDNYDNHFKCVKNMCLKIVRQLLN